MTHALTNKKQSAEHIAKRIASRVLNGTYLVSDETKKKMSESFKGRKHTEEWKKNLSERMKSNHPMKGKKHSPESRQKMSDSRRGVARPYLRGEKSHKWQGGKTDSSKILRQSVEYRNWRDAVYKRDDYTCQACGEKGGNLNPDHIMPLSIYPELALDVLNGRTLCHPCHKETDTYGSKMKKFEPEMTYLISNLAW